MGAPYWIEPCSHTLGHQDERDDRQANQCANQKREYEEYLLLPFSQEGVPPRRAGLPPWRFSSSDWVVQCRGPAIKFHAPDAVAFPSLHDAVRRSCPERFSTRASRENAAPIQAAGPSGIRDGSIRSRQRKICSLRRSSSRCLERAFNRSTSDIMPINRLVPRSTTGIRVTLNSAIR